MFFWRLIEPTWCCWCSQLVDTKHRLIANEVELEESRQAVRQAMAGLLTERQEFAKKNIQSEEKLAEATRQNLTLHVRNK